MPDPTVTAGSTRAAAPSAPAAPQPAGWFGKVPALGDFVARRIDSAFRDECDAWLSAGMLEGERLLGAEWPDLYLRFPVWRFLRVEAPPGSFGRAGLLAPGADRVGRLFPLVVTIPLAPVGAAPIPLDRLDARLERLEDALVELLESDDVDRFERRLNEHADHDGRDGPAGRGVADGIAAAWMRDGVAPATTFWRTDASGSMTTVTHRGRPDTGLFLLLVGAIREGSDGG